jgi:hypothetical protein
MQVRERSSQPAVLGLRIGEVVEVRSEREILATLDEDGRLEGLIFMPEMLQFCGQRFTVDKLAVKLCDTIHKTGMHRMHNAVHLRGVRCDGQAHGGCQAACLIYWKEAWLRRVGSDATEQPAGLRPSPVGECQPQCTTTRLLEVASTAPATPGSQEERFFCQATELVRAAPERLAWWDARAYARDVRSGNTTLPRMLRSLAVLVFNKFQGANARFLANRRLIHGGRHYPFLDGKLTRTPKELLNLQPGELVRIKSKEEIVRTLDVHNANRGLRFDAEMLKFCGRKARVLRRVDRIIDERTGKMLHFNSDCIMLEGVICEADFHQYCPRGIYSYWREIWLERVEAPGRPVS